MILAFQELGDTQLVFSEHLLYTGARMYTKTKCAKQQIRPSTKWPDTSTLGGSEAGLRFHRGHSALEGVERRVPGQGWLELFPRGDFDPNSCLPRGFRIRELTLWAGLGHPGGS